MINQDALEICKTRGHDAPGLGLFPNKWTKCKWCGMWVRELRTIEERTDEPPENEMRYFVGAK